VSAALRRRAPTLGPLALYTLLSVLFFGLPVFDHFHDKAIAADAIDASQFMWFYGWWPHAVLHGLNPLVTHLMFVPEGYNLTWSTAMPARACSCRRSRCSPARR